MLVGVPVVVIRNGVRFNLERQQHRGAGADPLHARKLLAYYYGGPQTSQMPFGLKMMAGNAHARGPLPMSVIAWS